MTTGKKKISLKMLFEIFMTFLKISPLTFGGGYVMIPLLEREMVTKKKWIKGEDIVDIFAVSESVPGAIAINSATFIGYHLAGVPGAIVAMLGMAIPSFVIIILLAALFMTVQDNLYVQAAFRGIRPAIVGLIFTAAIKIGKVSVIDKTCWVITILAATLLLIFTEVHPIVIILSGLVLGVVLTRVKQLIAEKSGTTSKVGAAANIEHK